MSNPYLTSDGHDRALQNHHCSVCEDKLKHRNEPVWPHYDGIWKFYDWHDFNAIPEYSSTGHVIEGTEAVPARRALIIVDATNHAICLDCHSPRWNGCGNCGGEVDLEEPHVESHLIERHLEGLHRNARTIYWHYSCLPFAQTSDSKVGSDPE